ncbi:MAG: MinD/ParA family protein [Epsilonproteobacteria bacterium]|nr:ATP-binding protein [Campylobacterota bacterium]NPA56694.1 MinD/ParA family protein [Campylobacterota bacterium]
MRFITITSGKGGVGKSTLAANISYLLSIYGYKIALFDADIGLANQDIILGVKPEKTILDVLKGDAEFRDIVIEINNNFLFIPGENSEEILSYKNSQIREQFYKGMEEFTDLDFLIIDTGAGIDQNVRTFVEAATDTIIVTMPDPLAIMDAYTLIKYSAKLQEEIYIIVNQAKSEKDGEEVAKKIIKVAEKHLKNIHIDFLGTVERNRTIEDATRQRKLVVRDFKSSIPAIQIANIVKKLTNNLTKDGQHIKDTPTMAVFFKRLFDSN